jgi:hypothetical protein
MRLVTPFSEGPVPLDSGIVLRLKISDPNASLQDVRMFYDDSLIGYCVPPEDTLARPSLCLEPGTHRIKAIAEGKDGSIVAEDIVAFEVYDPRPPYLGNFRFTVHKTSYGVVKPPIDTILYYDGTVAAFGTDDYKQNLFRYPKIPGYSKHHITITYWNNENVIANMHPDGKVDSAGFTFPSSYLAVTYRTKDTLDLSFCSGSLGGGYRFTATGIRR